MSKFSEFYNKVMTDSEIASAYNKAVEELKIPAGTPFSDFSDEILIALLPVVKKAGFEFSLEEIRAYFAKSSGDELSEDELEAVAGGCKATVHCDAIGSHDYY